MRLLCLCFFFVLLYTCYVSCTLSKTDKSTKRKKERKVKTSQKTVMERNLVVKDVKFKDITREHLSYCDDLHKEVGLFPGDVLAYVTPWNSHGYDIAKVFGNKFRYVAPVWLQVKRKRSGNYVIEGSHDVDKSWITDVTKGRKVKVLPRVLFDGWTGEDYQALFTSEDNTEDCVETILSFIKVHGFPGIVLEIWSQLGGHMRRDISHFVEHLSQAFHSSKKKLILVIPPPLTSSYGAPGMISREDFDRLAKHVDAFSLMTYDFSNAMSPGPNSPLSWMKACVETLVPNRESPYRKKLLLGLNFYGNDFVPGGGSPILGNQYIEILSKYKPKINWDESVAEHVFNYRTGVGDHTVYYPSLLSLKARLQLAEDLGTGVSIWEIGQGLDYWYDLF